MRILVAGTAAAMQHRLFIPFIITLAFLVHTTRADILVMIRGSNQVSAFIFSSGQFFELNMTN